MALKKKITLLYKDKNLCQKMGQKAKVKTINHYSWENYGKNVIQNYQKLINDNK